MKLYSPTGIMLMFSFMLLTANRSFAQAFENAGQYMDHIGKANQQLTEKYLVYLSGMSHGKSARKVEKRRLEVLQAISDTKFSIMGMPPYKGDRTLKDTTVAYLKILNNVFNEDYGKIVNMEEIAEQSYDLMEAYMLAQEKASEKLQQASDRQNEMQKQFAAKHNITIIESKSASEAKMKIASEVMKHYDEVYLIFFKSYKQEAYLMEALNQKKVNSIEQNLNSLQSYSEQGLEKLKELRGYNNDGSLIIACRNLLLFYKEEAKKGSALTDYYLKEENFTKLKKQFDSKSGSKRTQQDIDQFNKAVNDINAASKTYNEINNDLNKQRNTIQNAWNNAVKNFMDEYIPVQKR
ncbi:MAG: LIC11966 family surface protein [Chitinophagaceae bacterium]